MSTDDLMTYLARETALIRDVPCPEFDESCRRAEEALRRLAEMMKEDQDGTPSLPD
jgi:hypothetical protein